MAEQTFRQLCLRMKRPTLVKPTGLVYGLSGRSLDTVGQTEILVPGAGPVSVHVTRGLTHELLLGSDAIEKGHGVMDYECNTFKWYGHEYPLEVYPDSTLVLVLCWYMIPQDIAVSMMF